MNEQPPRHFLEYLFADIRAQAHQPLLYVRRGAAFESFTRREAAAKIGICARALQGEGIMPGDRVAFQAPSDHRLWLAEWGVLSSRGVVVVVPRTLTVSELAETLSESKSKVLFVDRFETAMHVAEAQLPDLIHIVCFEENDIPQPGILSWDAFMESGEKQPDRAAALLRSINSKDTAALFYYKDTNGIRQATRYSHGLLLEHAQKIQATLAAHGIRKDDIVLSTVPWEHTIGHVASCYVPLLKEASLLFADYEIDKHIFEIRPNVVVGTAEYFTHLRAHITDVMERPGKIEKKLFAKALGLSKRKYESAGKSGLLRRLQDSALEVMVVNKVRKMLGGRLRLLIGVDDEADYDTQLFFHTFGIELIELPEDAFAG